MLSKTEKQFTAIFSLIVILELISNQIESLSSLHIAVKPLIVISIMFFFYKQSKSFQKSIRQLMLLALFFSLMGDVLLMFVEQNPLFFICGLIAFLLAHVMYILVFIKNRKPSQKVLPIIVVLLIYGSGLFYVLKDGLGEMLIPVIAYMLVILTMATTAFLRKGNDSSQSYQLVFLGAVLFLISDSLLALNMFYKPIPLASISIMVTYALAQFFIVFGILKQVKVQ